MYFCTVNVNCRIVSSDSHIKQRPLAAGFKAYNHTMPQAYIYFLSTLTVSSQYHTIQYNMGQLQVLLVGQLTYIGVWWGVHLGKATQDAGGIFPVVLLDEDGVLPILQEQVSVVCSTTPQTNNRIYNIYNHII